MEEKIIAACGNDCSLCPRYNKVPFVKSDEELSHTAELWYKIGYRDHVVSNEEISCQGCTQNALSLQVLLSHNAKKHAPKKNTKS